jgi:hypothetical protein
VKPSITKGYCGDIYDRWDGNAALSPLAQMGANMEKGMVLAMSTWYAKETYTNGKVNVPDAATVWWSCFAF